MFYDVEDEEEDEEEDGEEEDEDEEEDERDEIKGIEELEDAMLKDMAEKKRTVETMDQDEVEKLIESAPKEEEIHTSFLVKD